MPSFYVKVLPLFRLISPHHLSTRPIQDSKSSLSLNVDLGTGQLVGPKKKLSAAYHPQVIYNDQDFIFLSHLAGSWHDMFSLKTSLRPICWPLVLTRVSFRLLLESQRNSAHPLLEIMSVFQEYYIYTN